MSVSGDPPGRAADAEGALSSSLFAVSGEPGEPVNAVIERAVLALCRLIRLSTVGLANDGGAGSHATTGTALATEIERQIEETAIAARELSRKVSSGQGTSFCFTQGVAFVSGKLLKAGRASYDEVVRAGAILDGCGIEEIIVARDVSATDFKTLSIMLGEFHRSPEPVVPERITQRIRLRAANEAARRQEVTGRWVAVSNEEIVHTYASAIVVMRRFYDGLRKERFELPGRFRRIAQRLVDLSAGETPAFLGVTAARNANHDDAGRAVNTAVLSLAMARQITSDALLLERLAMAALLYDAAKRRLVGRSVEGEGGASVLPELSEAQDAQAPQATAVVLTALGAVTDASVVRTVLAYEAHWLKRVARLGPLYRGLRPPLLQARIISVARAFNDLLTPAAGREPLAADDAIAKLEQDAEGAADRTALRLLIGALGIFPTGTLVELSTGEVALVVKTPSHPALYSWPRVRLVFDASGGPIDRLIEIDLAQAAPPGEPARHVRRVVATSDDASATSMRSFASLPSSASGSSSARHRMNATPPSKAHRTSARSGAKPPAAQGSQPRDPPTDSSSRIQGVSTPPTPPTMPVSSVAVRRQEGSPVRSPTPQPATVARSVDLASLDLDDDAANPITRQLPWHNKAFLLLMEQVEAHRASSLGAGALSRSDRQHEAPPPTAEGTLAKTPLVHLLVYMLDRGLSGTTLFQTPDGTNHAIYFWEGAPAKVRTGATVAPLDEVLLELELLEEESLLEALAEAQDRRILLGRYLVSAGYLDRDTLLAVLNEQLARKLLALFAMPLSTQYAYYDGINLLDGYAGAELFACEPLAIVMAGVRISAQEQVVRATLDRIASRPIGLHPEADTRRFRMESAETRVVELLRKQKMTVEDLVRAGVAQERVVLRTLYALVITRHLDLGIAARPPVGASSGGSSDTNPPSLRGGPIVLKESPQPVRDNPRRESPDPTPAKAPPPVSPDPTPVVAAAQPVAARPAPPLVRSAGGGMFTAPAGSTDPQPPAPTAPATASTSAVMRSPPEQRPPAAAVPWFEPKQDEDDHARLDSSARLAVTPPPPSSGISPPPRVVPSKLESPVERAPTATPAAARTAEGTESSARSSSPSREPPASSDQGRFTPPAASPPPADPMAAATARERRAEIEKRAASIDAEDYFAALGATRESSASELQAAYFALAKRWHPDRVHGDLADVKPVVAHIFARITEAYRTLSDPAKRADYLRALEAGLKTPADEHSAVVRAVDASVEFQKAEVLLKKNDLAGAEALAKKAAQIDPDQPQYLTLLVWIQALRRGNPPPVTEGRSTGFYDDLIKSLDRVIAKEPNYERALFYRGTLLQRSGRVDKAMGDFRRVIEINPRNIDAAREVRLHGMRARGAPPAEAQSPAKGPKKGKPPDDGSPPEGGGGGLLNKIFKR